MTALDPWIVWLVAGGIGLVFQLLTISVVWMSADVYGVEQEKVRKLILGPEGESFRPLRTLIGMVRFLFSADLSTVLFLMTVSPFSLATGSWTAALAAALGAGILIQIGCLGIAALATTLVLVGVRAASKHGRR